MPRRALPSLLICCAASLSWAPATGTLSGRVTDDLGRPVAGARVTITSVQFAWREATAITDDLGRYEQSGLVPRTYWLRVEAPGLYQRVERTGSFPGLPIYPRVEVRGDTDTSADLGMIRPAWIQGQLTRRYGPKGQAQWVAVISPGVEGFRGYHLVRCERDGTFRVPLEWQGEDAFGLEVGSDWYTPMRKLKLVAGATTQIPCDLRRAARIAGRVYRADGRTPEPNAWITACAPNAEPIGGCSLRVSSAARSERWDALAGIGGPDPWHPVYAATAGWHGEWHRALPDTNTHGAFEIARLPTGDYEVSASTETHTSEVLKIRLEDGQIRRGLKLVLSKKRE